MAVSPAIGRAERSTKEIYELALRIRERRLGSNFDEVSSIRSPEPQQLGDLAPNTGFTQWLDVLRMPFSTAANGPVPSSEPVIEPAQTESEAESGFTRWFDAFQSVTPGAPEEPVGRSENLAEGAQVPALVDTTDVTSLFAKEEATHLFPVPELLPQLSNPLKMSRLRSLFKGL